MSTCATWIGRALLLTLACAGVSTASEPGPETVVAIVGETLITRADLDRRERGRLAAVRAERFAIERTIVEEAIEEALLAEEAARRGLSVETLLGLEVDGRLPEPTGDDLEAAYEHLRAESPDRPFGEIVRLVAGQFSRPQLLRRRRRAFLEELRATTRVRVLLEAPRARLPKAPAPSRGPADAPVTIVGFSDFECPYCASVLPALERVAERYAGDVRFEFRNFPLSFHEHAAKAAEAAQCAHEQSRFWEMHDRLFADQTRLAIGDLRQHAADLGLDGQRFAGCLDSGRYAERCREDVEAGARAGVTGTPTFFINGRLLTGAQPFEQFARIIDDELARLGAQAMAGHGH